MYQIETKNTKRVLVLILLLLYHDVSLPYDNDSTSKYDTTKVLLLHVYRTHYAIGFLVRPETNEEAIAQLLSEYGALHAKV